VENLKKKYGKVEALRGLDLNISEGSIHGLIGPNGAGKSTTIKILATLVRPDSGNIAVNNIPINKGISIRRMIGVVPEVPRLHESKSARGELKYHSRMHSIRGKDMDTRISDLIKAVHLEEMADRPIKSYSTGMKKRTALALALLHDPDILLLDEPMSGLDPVIRKQFKDIILELNEKGKTILISDHDLHTVEELCDRVTIIQKGRTIVEEDLETLRDETGHSSIAIKVGDNCIKEHFCREISALECVRSISQERDHFIVNIHEPARSIPEIIRTASRNADIMEAKKTKITLEDIFLKFTGERNV
jgi:ABC-2 type transport system ATP-binding protein